MAEGKTSLFQNFWTDLTNVKLIKAKFIWFTYMFGLVGIYPFLNLHMKSLGLSDRDVGIISSIIAVINIIAPFMWGFIADKIGNFKLLLSGLTFFTGVTVLCLPVIPSSSSSTGLSDCSSNTTNVGCSNITTTNITTNVTLSHQANDNYVRTFWLYFFARGIFRVVAVGSYTLYQGAIMSYMKEHNMDYGMQRLWGTLAAGISSGVGGLLADFYGMEAVFCVSGAFYIITAAALLFFDLKFKKSAKNLCKGIFSQIINPEIVMLLLVIMAVGAIKSYITTFYYIFLSGLGASNTLIGLTISAGVPFSIIIQFCTTVIVHKFGFVNTLATGISMFSLRVLVVCFLTNPWWVLPFEILESVAEGLFDAASIMYCTDIIPLSSLVSFKSIMYVFGSGLGRLLGVSIGTIICEHIGDRNTFLGMSIFGFAIAVTYLVAYRIFKKYQRNHLSKRNPLAVSLPTQNRDKEIEKGIDNPVWEDDDCKKVSR